MLCLHAHQLKVSYWIPSDGGRVTTNSWSASKLREMFPPHLCLLCTMSMYIFSKVNLYWPRLPGVMYSWWDLTKGVSCYARKVDSILHLFRNICIRVRSYNSTYFKQSMENNYLLQCPICNCHLRVNSIPRCLTSRVSPRRSGSSSLEKPPGWVSE